MFLFLVIKGTLFFFRTYPLAGQIIMLLILLQIDFCFRTLLMND